MKKLIVILLFLLVPIKISAQVQIRSPLISNPNVTITLPDGTFGAPSISFNTNTGLGLFRAGVDHLGIVSDAFTSFYRISGNTYLTLTYTGSGGGIIGFSDGAGGSNDAFLGRFSPNTIAVRNGTNAQGFRIFKTFTNIDNGEWLSLSGTGGLFDISSNQNGTGLSRNLTIGTIGSSPLAFYTNSITRMTLQTTGEITLGTDSHLLGTEMTAPAAPAVNQGVIFFQDNGAGKTQACARFNSGAIQCFATQP